MPRMTRLELTDKLLKSLIKVLPYYANPSISWLPALSFSFLKPFLAPRSEYSKSPSALSAGQPFPLPGVIARFAARTAEFLLALYAIHVYVNSKATSASHCPIRLRPRRALISTKTSKRRSKRMAVPAGLWYAEKFFMWTRRICFQVYTYFVEKVPFQLVPNFSSKSAVKHPAQPDGDSLDPAIRDPSDQ